MFHSKFLQITLRFALVVGSLLVTALTARAQTPAPTGPTLSDHIARLSIKASQLLPYLQNEVLSHLQEWVYGIAIAVAVLVLLFSFLRLWRENAGGNSNLIFFFLRLLFFFGLVGSSVWIIGQMAATGREIAEGSEITGSAGRGLLFEFYKAQRDSFNESYEKLVMGTFTVKVDGRDFTVQPNSDSAGTFLELTAFGNFPPGGRHLSDEPDARTYQTKEDERSKEVKVEVCVTAGILPPQTQTAEVRDQLGDGDRDAVHAIL
jgi:hypothetical protein